MWVEVFRSLTPAPETQDTQTVSPYDLMWVGSTVTRDRRAFLRLAPWDSPCSHSGLPMPDRVPSARPFTGFFVLALRQANLTNI